METHIKGTMHGQSNRVYNVWRNIQGSKLRRLISKVQYMETQRVHCMGTHREGTI